MSFSVRALGIFPMTPEGAGQILHIHIKPALCGTVLLGDGSPSFKTEKKLCFFWGGRAKVPLYCCYSCSRSRQKKACCSASSSN